MAYSTYGPNDPNKPPGQQQGGGLYGDAGIAGDPGQQQGQFANPGAQATDVALGGGGGQQFGGGAAPGGAPGDGASTQGTPGQAAGEVYSPVTPTGQISPGYGGVAQQAPAGQTQMMPNGDSKQESQAQQNVGGAGGAGNQVRDLVRNTYGLDMTPEQTQQLMAAVGYTGEGQPTQQQLEQAHQIISNFLAQGGTGGGGNATAAPQTNNIGDPLPLQGPANPVIGNPTWTPGTFKATPTNRVDFGSLMNRYMTTFGANPYEAMGQGSLGTHTPVNMGGNYTPTQFTGGYNAANFSQYAPPDQSGAENQQIGALTHALGNSEWSPERVAAQKEVQKEQALSMARQSQEQFGDAMAARGRSDSGAQAAGSRRINSDAQEHILGSYRDIDENAANARRAELLATSGALDSALGGQSQRGALGYTTKLSGEKTQADDIWRSSQMGLDIQGMQADENSRGFGNNLQKNIAQEGANLGAFGANNSARGMERDDAFRAWGTRDQAANTALKTALGEVASEHDYNDLDWEKEQFAQNFPEDQRQSNINSFLEMFGMLDNQDMNRQNLGLDWTKFNFDALFPRRS